MRQCINARSQYHKSVLETGGMGECHESIVVRRFCQRSLKLKRRNWDAIEFHRLPILLHELDVVGAELAIRTNKVFGCLSRHARIILLDVFMILNLVNIRRSPARMDGSSSPAYLWGRVKG